MKISTKKNSQKIKIQVLFGKHLRAQRLAMALTQEKLGELSNLHFTYISSTERGERNISLVSMYKLAVALNRSLKDLMPY